jgi:hypothetical protein
MSIYDEMAEAGPGNRPHDDWCPALYVKAAHTDTKATRESRKSPATGQGVALASLAQLAHTVDRDPQISRYIQTSRDGQYGSSRHYEP